MHLGGLVITATLDRVQSSRTSNYYYPCPN